MKCQAQNNLIKTIIFDNILPAFQISAFMKMIHRFWKLPPICIKAKLCRPLAAVHNSFSED